MSCMLQRHQNLAVEFLHLEGMLNVHMGHHQVHRKIHHTGKSSHLLNRRVTKNALSRKHSCQHLSRPCTFLQHTLRISPRKNLRTQHRKYMRSLKYFLCWLSLSSSGTTNMIQQLDLIYISLRCRQRNFLQLVGIPPGIHNPNARNYPQENQNWRDTWYKKHDQTLL